MVGTHLLADAWHQHQPLHAQPSFIAVSRADYSEVATDLTRGLLQLIMVAREQARAATIMFLRCFFVFLFFLFFFFIFLFFFIFFVCRQLIMSKASAYGR
jgi:hypothetical protein